MQWPDIIFWRKLSPPLSAYSPTRASQAGMKICIFWKKVKKRWKQLLLYRVHYSVSNRRGPPDWCLLFVIPPFVSTRIFQEITDMLPWFSIVPTSPNYSPHSKVIGGNKTIGAALLCRFSFHLTPSRKRKRNDKNTFYLSLSLFFFFSILFSNETGERKELDILEKSRIPTVSEWCKE